MNTFLWSISIGLALFAFLVLVGRCIGTMSEPEEFHDEQS